jgi:hypothetical protein
VFAAITFSFPPPYKKRLSLIESENSSAAAAWESQSLGKHVRFKYIVVGVVGIAFKF